MWKIECRINWWQTHQLLAIVRVRPAPQPRDVLLTFYTNKLSSVTYNLHVTRLKVLKCYMR